MLHFPTPIPNNMIRRPQRSDSLLGLSQQDNATLAILPDELHDMRRVQAYGQEEDLKEALGKMIGRVEELSAMLGQAQKTRTELETNLKLAKSNLQLALANNEMLEDALRRESTIGSKDVGWRRTSGRPESRQGHHARAPSESLINPQSRPPSRQGSVSVQSTPTSEAMVSPGVGPAPESPAVRPANSPVQPAPPVQHDSRFFRFRFGSSSASSSPNLNAGPSRPRTPPATAGSVPNSRRQVDALRERDAAHLTSASLPSLVASTDRREEELIAELAEVRAKLEKVSLEKHTLEQEVESLSQALFEEANKMVAQERIKCAEIEEELRQVRQEKDALKSAMRVIEQENERLKSPDPGSELGLASPDANVSAGGSEPTPHSSRQISQSRRLSQSEAGSTRSESVVTRGITRQRATSSTRGFREKSSSSERGWASTESPSHASVPLPDSDSEHDSAGSEKMEKPPYTDAGAEQAPNIITDKEEGREKDGEAPTFLLTSPTFPTMPLEESPWTRL